MNRREALFSFGAMAAATATVARAGTIGSYSSNMALDPAFVPRPARLGGQMQVLTDDAQRRTLAAAFDRLMPEDEYGPSATQAGCIEFLDGQLAGPYGAGDVLYREGPKMAGEDALMQAPQFIATPRERYETGLAALDAYTQANDGAVFADLQPNRQDEILQGLEEGTISLSPEVNSKAFFELMLNNVREGYFSDPIYGGNKDMAGWKLIGFPGARYDYRLYADRVGEKLDLEPVCVSACNLAP